MTDDHEDPIAHNDFFVPAADNKGHSARLQVRIQPKLDRDIDKVIGGKFFPYKTKSDLIRHSITHLLTHLGQMAPIPTSMKQIEAMNQILLDERFNAEYMDVFSRMKVLIDQHIEMDRGDMATELVNQMLSQIESMPEGNWKRIYLDRIRKQHGYLIKEFPGTLKDLL